MITFLHIFEHVYCVLATVLIIAELCARKAPIMPDHYGHKDKHGN